ncbi:Rhodanese-like domain-containing protein [Xylaria nigripes]|nr:Rhodanese-like domain-containing protein [Xylaria nigripes]
MASILSRRIFLAGLAARPCVRPSSCMRAGFATTPRFRNDGDKSVGETASQSQQQTSTGSRIWTFEEINALIQSKNHIPPEPDLEAPDEESNPHHRVDKRTYIVDVREPAELASTGKIPGALNIPLKSRPDSFHISQSEFEERYGFQRPKINHPVVFYCLAGVRAKAAARLAQRIGWQYVGEFPGSWREWEEKGGEVEKVDE